MLRESQHNPRTTPPVPPVMEIIVVPRIRLSKVISVVPAEALMV